MFKNSVYKLVKKLKNCKCTNPNYTARTNNNHHYLTEAAKEQKVAQVMDEVIDSGSTVVVEHMIALQIKTMLLPLLFEEEF